MAPEQAIQNLETLMNIAIQRGLFQSANDVQAISESINVFKNQSGVSIQQPNYTSTNTSEIKENGNG